MVRTRRPSAAVLLVATVCAAVVGVRIPAQFPMPGYFADIQEWAASGRIADTFTPLAYPLFAGAAFRVAGVPGVIWLQALLFVAMALAAMGILRRLGLPEAWAAVGALPVVFQPEYVLSIPKLWDVDLSTYLLLLFVLVALRLQSTGGGIGTWVAAGAVLGAGVFCRPNYALMFPVVLYAAWTSPGAASRRSVQALAASVAVAILVFAGLSELSHGSVFLPRNGPYNLFAGNNPYAETALLEKLNAEPSLPQAFAAMYPPPLPDMSAPGFFYEPALQPFYSHAAAEFAIHHPVAEAELVGVKLWTLFRPDTKVHALGSFYGFGKLVLALPAPALLLVLIVTRRHGLDKADRLLLLAYGAYVLPFLITNSDPRFRLPLDGALLLHLVRRLYLAFGKPRTRSFGQPAGIVADVAT